MREILFRGKITQDEWVYGFYENVKLEEATIHYINGKIVSSKTVGQYTGLTDKNGKKIFEGDILRGFEYPFCSNINGEFNYFAEIVWFDDSSAFGIYTFKNPKSNVRGISEGNTDYLEYFNADKWEVIGNIHDNPELLEGGEGNG